MMATIRSRRLRLLESMRKTISNTLHARVWNNVPTHGEPPIPQNTSAIYATAMATDPELLDQLLFVHHRTRQELGEIPRCVPPCTDVGDGERKKMLSAVRAAVMQSELRFGV